MSKYDVIYGRQPVLELLRAHRRSIKRVLMFKRVKGSAPIKSIRKLCENHNVPLQYADHPVLDRLVKGGNHQGVAAECGAYPYVTLDEVKALTLENQPLFLLLDHIQDPQNLGAILRSADAVGVDAVLLPADRAVHITPAVVRVSAGASEHLRICIAGNLHQTMLDLKDKGVTFSGLEMDAAAKPYTETAFADSAHGLVIGSEGSGLTRVVKDTCDHLISIPMHGKVGSLNASAAAAVALYEILRRRGLSSDHCGQPCRDRQAP